MTTPTNTIDYQAYRKKDEQLYDEWKQNPNKKTMGKLIHQLAPVIQKEVRRQTGALPAEALGAEAKKWAIHAIKVYDPDRGAAVSTHVTNYVRKIRRMNYTYQNSARLPEHMQREFNPYNNALQDLSSVLNREPTDKEMAAKLGWAPAKVTKFRKALYDDHFESGTDKATTATSYNNDQVVMNYVRENLTPEELILWDNSKKISSTDLAKKLKVNVNQLNYLKKKLTLKVKGLQNDLGDY